MDIDLVFRIIKVAIIILFFAIFLGVFISVAGSITIFINEQTKKTAIGYSGKTILNTQEQLDCSETLLQAINVMIELECANVLRSYIFLHKSYDILNLDKDTQTISTNVFSGIKKELFNSANIIYTDTYIIKYITSQSTLILLKNIKEANMIMTNH